MSLACSLLVWWWCSFCLCCFFSALCFEPRLFICVICFFSVLILVFWCRCSGVAVFLISLRILSIVVVIVELVLLRCVGSVVKECNWLVSVGLVVSRCVWFRLLFEVCAVRVVVFRLILVVISVSCIVLLVSWCSLTRM